MLPRPETLLLIDDDPAWTLLVREGLRRAWPAPLALLVAEDLATGLRRLADHPVDLVLLDLGLPGLRDLDAMRALVEAMAAGAGLRPVVVLSGFLTDVLRREVLRQGGQECVSKDDPAVWPALAGAMERAWARHTFWVRGLAAWRQAGGGA